MADCYAPESDDLHRRWLPREILADIGISDPAPAVADADAVPPPAVSVEELAAQLAGILGAGTATAAKVNSLPKRAPPSPPPPKPIAPAPAAVAKCRPAPPVCGGGGCSVVAGGAAVAWPATPYQPWQVANTFVHVAGALDYTQTLPPAPPRLLVLPPPPPPPELKPRGGTGVFLPRVPPPARDSGKAPNPRAWPGRSVQQQAQKGGGGEAAAAAEWRQGGAPQKQKAAAGAALVHGGTDVAVVGLPKEWTYLP